MAPPLADPSPPAFSPVLQPVRLKRWLPEGKKDITPYWRTLKSKGELNEKYPGGVEAQAKHLRAEGHNIELDKNNKPRKVKDWEKKLVEV